MPSTSKKQRNFMAAAAHNPAFAKKVGISQKVAKEFNQADKGKKFGSGGMAHSEKGEMKQDVAQDKKLIKKAFGMHDKQQHEAKKTNLSKLKGGGMARMKEKGEHPVQKQSKRGTEMVKMRKGGKCYEEGGEIEFETKTGRNENIGDDTRARAMAALEKGISDDTPAAPKAAPSFKSKATKAGFTSAETGGGAALMTRKDRRSTPAAPKASPKKPSNIDYSVGNAMKKGGVTRADGCAVKGKTKGRMV